MRKELDLIEKIEEYLQGKMTAEEVAAFEKEIASDASLKEEIELQQQLMQGISRTILKQNIIKAGKRFRLMRNIGRWGISGAVIIIAALTTWYFFNSNKAAGSYTEKSLPAINESGTREWTDADKKIPAQIFTIDAGRDTVLETRAGIVLSVPADNFLDEDNRPVNGKIELVVKEALDATTIMKSGLSTVSGDNLLETGGMFFVDARKDGRALKIDSLKGIYAELPTDTVRPGMQLYKGKRLPDGSIDWVQPRALEHDLIPVDITQLDFYPSEYLKTVAHAGYNIADKKFTDSLYYSLASLFTVDPTNKAPAENEQQVPKVDTSSQFEYFDSVKDLSSDSTSKYCGINPAKIKAIWNKHFQNTLLSTREFQERILYIHEIGNNEILDLYIRNLDKELSYIDSIVATKLSGEPKEHFLQFAARHDGKLKKGNKNTQRLFEYYNRKTKAYQDAITKTENDFWTKQNELDNIAAIKNEGHILDSMKRAAANFEDELKLNLKDAYRQLGYDTSQLKPPTGPVYSVQITTTGWNNVDKAVYESTVNQTTLNYTDPKTGKTAVIQYLSATFSIQRWNEYDQVYVYLLPDNLNSFKRLDGPDGIYSTKLDELIQYTLVCIAWKNDKPYFFSPGKIKAANYSNIELTEASEKQLEEKINALSKFGNTPDMLHGLNQEMDFIRVNLKDQKRQKHNADLMQLKFDLMRQLFPCYVNFDAASK